MFYIECFERVYSYRLTEYVVSELCVCVSHVVLYFSLSSKHASACGSGDTHYLINYFCGFYILVLMNLCYFLYFSPMSKRTM